jgi:aminopeptidase N
MKLRFGTAALAAALACAAPAAADPTFEPLPRGALELHEVGRLALPRGVSSLDLATMVGRMARSHEVVSPLAPEAPAEPSNYGGYYNILHMDVAVDLDPTTGEMTVVETVKLVSNQDDLDQIPLGFPGFEVTSVTTPEDLPVPFEAFPAQNLIRISPEVPLAKDEELTFVLTAAGKPECKPGGLVQACDFTKNLSYVTHAQYYPRNQSVMLDMFRAELSVTVPTGTVVAGTGRLFETTEDAEAAKTTFRFTHDFETELLSFAMAPYETLTDESGEYPITLYVTKSHAGNMNSLLDLAKDILALYAEIYAPFPFLNIDIVEIGNSFGGGYGPQATIMMLSDIMGVSPDTNYWASLVQLMSHELAHQYWGNFVNIGSADSVSLSEGLAEFSSAYHFEQRFETRSNFVQNGMNYMYTVPENGDAAVGSASLYYSQYYTTIAYDKASVVFDMLRHELGDEAFFAGMQLYVDIHGYDSADIYDFFLAHETASGQDLGWFFNQWMLRTGSPVLTVAVAVEEDPAGGATLTMRFDQDGKPFKMHVPVQITLHGTGEKLDLDPAWIEDESTTVSWKLDAAPMRVSTDPKRTLLQRTYAALPGDVNLSGAVDGSDLLDLAVLFRRNIVVKYGSNEWFIPNGGYLPRFDLNRDGYIDEADLELVLQGFGEVGMPASVEPPAGD